MSTVQKHRAGAPAWFDLMTPEPERARAFYGALFGWTFQVGPAEMGHYAMCQLQGRNAAGMGQMPPGAPFPTAWNVYFAVDEVDATGARVRERGGQVVMGPMDVAAEGRLAFCADPTGAHFGLWQPRRHTGAQVKDEPGAMTWAEVYTRDPARARDFYGAVLGLESRRLEGEGMDYWTLHQGPDTVAGLLKMDAQWPAQVPAHWTAYFAVADADASVRQVTSLGGQVHMPPFDTPYGRIAGVSDPFGARFCVIKLSPLALQG